MFLFSFRVNFDATPLTDHGLDADSFYCHVIRRMGWKLQSRLPDNTTEYLYVYRMG